MGRPRKSGDTLVVDIDGDLLVWTDGLISGDNKELIDKAKLASRLEIPTPLTIDGPEVPASLDDPNEPIRALAALVAANPGRATILQAPEEIIALLPFPDEDEEDDNLEVIE